MKTYQDRSKKNHRKAGQQQPTQFSGSGQSLLPPPLQLFASHSPVTQRQMGEETSRGSGSRFTTPFRDGRPASEYQISVLVDQPGSGGDRDMIEGTDVGHTAIRLTRYYDDGPPTSRTFGFYPVEGLGEKLASMISSYISTGLIQLAFPGELRDNSREDSRWDVIRSLSISQSSFMNVLDYVDAHHQDTYNLETYNCTDFAIRAAAAGGFVLPDSSFLTLMNAPIPLPILFQFPTNPGGLGENIRELHSPE